MRLRHAIGLAIMAAALLVTGQANKTQATKKAAPRAAHKGAAAASSKRRINLSTSKVLLDPAPGGPQAVNSLPLTLAVSPDGRYVAALNNGYGTRASALKQSIAVLDRQSGTITDFPDERLAQKAKQTYFLGLTFSRDGSKLYASIGSLTDPTGSKKDNTGNGIAVYSFSNGALAPESFIPIAPQKLAPGRRAALAFKDLTPGAVAPFPAGIALLGDGSQMLVANNLSDNAVIINTRDGSPVQAFDFSAPGAVPAIYPYEVVTTRDSRRAWVSLWNASEVAELDLRGGKIVRRIAMLGSKSKLTPGSHPTALLLSPDEKYLYVTLATRDSVAVIETASGRVAKLLSTQLPGQKYDGLYPSALAQTGDGRRLFVANSSADAVAVFDTSALKKGGVASVPRTAMGFIPTEWYPTALAVVGDELVIATGKGKGVGPNGIAIGPKDPGARTWMAPNSNIGHPYILSLQSGSIARVNIAEAQRDLKQLTAEVLESNLMNGRAGRIEIPAGKIKHVIYMIKENRTFDQVFGDIAGADGDPSLVMYGEAITPNQHKLARQFGVLDNFYDSGEISGNGHDWSDAAITSDFNEKIVHLNYRGKERMYDFEGTVMYEVPMEQEIPDINEPGTSYLWSHAAKHGLTHRNYGEFTTTVYCAKTEEWDAGPPPPENTPNCPRKVVRKGEPLPPHLGDPPGGPSPYPWDIPLIAWSKPLKPELRNNYDANYPYFNLSIPDQLRADEFLLEFRGFVRAREAGKGTELPQLIVMQLPNDHTRGTQAGSPRPAAYAADNDLALGRIVDAVSHSPYWDDTAILVLEDDAQDGADHVDAHRSTALVISKYAPRATGETPIVHHQFYTTVNMVRTIEALLGLPPMNHNDAQAAVMAPLFSGAGDQPPFNVDWRNRDNGLLYEMNPPKAPGSAESMAMDWSHPDAIDAQKLNAILWRDAKGDVPMPEPIYAVIPKRGGRD